MKRLSGKPPIALLLVLALATPASAMQIAKRIPGPDGGWDYASFDAEGHRLFIARANAVQTVDIGTGQVTPAFLPAQRGHSAFVMPGTGLGLSTNGTSNTATIFDARTGAIKAQIPTGKKPDAAIYDASTRLAYVMNGDDGTVTLIDPKAMRAVGTIPVGGKLEFAAADGQGHMYVNVEDKAEIVAIDVAGRKVTRRVKLTSCEEPSGLALTRQGTLIASCGNGVAKLVDAATFHQLPDVAIGEGPDAVLYDNAHDRAYIPSGQSGTLAVFDTSATIPRKIDTVTTQRGARTGAVDPATGTVYLPTAHYAEKQPGEERPQSIPGTFEVLVIAN